MTNSKILDDKSLSAEEASVKASVKADVKKQTLNDDRASHSKEKRSTQVSLTNKQNSKKSVSKAHLARAKSKPEVESSIRQKVTRSKSKTLSKSEGLAEPLRNCDKVNKKNKNAAKEHVVSPNHSITEYFSSLDLKGHANGSASNLDNIKLDNLDSRPSRSLSSSKENKPESLRQAIKNKVDLGNHKLTEYFAIRRSDRKYKKEIENERQKDLEKKIIEQVEDGLEIKEFDQKGRGIVTTRAFRRGDFVVEYVGELIDRITAKQRETQYSKNKNVGCYMYYFRHKDQQYCIDATKESGKFGRLINHSRKGNLMSRIVEVDKLPHLVLFAKTDIPTGVELLYDYGDRNQETIKSHPWLNL